MNEFFESGRAVDLVLVVLVIEAVWLVATRRMSVARTIAALLPGARILSALRGALTDAAWPWVATPLILSFPAHLADLAIRRHAERS